MTTSGIFNPFDEPKKPKTEYKSPFAQDPRELRGDRLNPKVMPSISLDGDKYVVEFNGAISLEDVRRILYELLEELSQNPKNEKYLRLNGVRLVPAKEDPNLDKEEMLLALPQGGIVVHAGFNGTEIDIYRRLGYALCAMDDRILKKHHVNVYTRG